jgi:hypothetical protein
MPNRESRCFRTIGVVDFEYEIDDGDLPRVLCMVAYLLDANLRHVGTARVWRGESGSTPPFDVGPDSLVVGYSLWAELTCFLTLSWRFPVHVYDLHTAFFATSNILLPSNPDDVRKKPRKRLSDACRTYGIEGWENIDKPDIAKAIGEGRWREYGRGAVLQYCGGYSRLGGIAAASTHRLRQPRSRQLRACHALEPVRRQRWKDENPGQRQRMKALQLGINYGMGVRSLSRGLNRHLSIGSEVIIRHQHKHPVFWAWRESNVRRAMLERVIVSEYHGWPLHISTSPNERTLFNFPMQSGDAEILRLAANRLCDAGLVPSMLVHDGILL